jgi:hypothetical protein
MERILGFLPFAAKIILALSPPHSTWVKTLAEWILRGDRRAELAPFDAPPGDGQPARRVSDQIGFRPEDPPGGGS